MATKNLKSQTKQEITHPSLGVINPYALAELIIGKKIDWKDVQDVPQFLETVFQMPYHQLFDPKFGGPLYIGSEVDGPHRLKPSKIKLQEYEPVSISNDMEGSDFESIEKIGDLSDHYPDHKLENIPIESYSWEFGGYLKLNLKEPENMTLKRLSRVLSLAVLKSILPFYFQDKRKEEWTPPNSSWGLRGKFFNETAEFFDPIQGNVANCYYIAALSAVAWARPFMIKHMTRATGMNQENFNNQISFYLPDSNSQIDKNIEVSSSIPLAASNDYIYARSSEGDETWPCILEKAFAKFKTGVTHDHPDITATAWGDTVWATSILTGGQRHYYNTVDHTGDALWDIIRSNSLGRRTFNPITAWTYSSGDESKKKDIYIDTNIVASHCYTILGWEYYNRNKYIIIRNPWGHTEATVNTLNSTVFLHDISWWRPINLTTVDGVFAIEASTFQQYFAGIGVVV
jgi:hypothetical protein